MTNERRSLPTEVLWTHLGNVSIELRSMRCLQSGAQSEVRQLQVTSGVEKQIVRFDVSMDESQSMNGFDRLGGFSDVEERHLFAEDLLLDQQRHQIAPGKEFHDQIEVTRVLEGVEHLHRPGVISLDENVPFGTDVSHLFPEKHLFFPKDLHRVDVTSITLLNQTNLGRRRRIQERERVGLGLTSPKAPRPITFNGWKSSALIFTRFNRRYSVSFAAWE